MAAKTSDVVLFKSRSLVGRLAASFRFLNDNLSLFLRLGTYVLLPMAVVEALYLAFFRPVSPEGGDVVAMVAGAIAGIVVVAGHCFFGSLVFTLLKKQAELGGLPAYRLKDLKAPLLANARKVFSCSLLLFAIGLLCGVLAVVLAMLTPWTLVLTLPLLLFVMVPLSYTIYIYIFEETTLLSALVKSFKLGVPAWGATFAVLLVSFLVALIIQVVAVLPWYTALMVDHLAYLSQMRGEAVALPGFFSYLMFFLALVGILISSIANTIAMSAMAFQYGSAETKRKEQLTEETQLP